MRTLLYQEIKNIMQEIEIYDSTNSAETLELQKQSLITTMESIIVLANVARKEGLLSLEEEADKLDNSRVNRFLKDTVLLIVDGTEPGAVEEIGTTKFFTSKLHDYDALNCIMSLIGVLEIQMGINPRLIESHMLAFLPSELADKYRDKKEQEEKRIEQGGHLDMREVDALCEGEMPIKYGDEGYFIVKLVEYAFTNIDDKNVQRILRDIDNNDLAIMLKGMSGQARRRVFDNMSERLAHMIALDMNFMGYVRVRDVAEASTKVLNVIVKLHTRGEILMAESPIFSELCNMFIGTALDEYKKKESEQENQLEKLFREYKNRSNTIIP